MNHAGDTTYKTQSYPNNIMTNKTVDVIEVHQSTKIDTQRHITDKNQGGGSTALERPVTHLTGGLNLV